MKSIVFNVVSIFPDMFLSPFNYGIIKKAIDRRQITINRYDLRDYTTDRYRNIDDYSYGGGAGMIMKPEPFIRVIKEIKKEHTNTKILLTTPQGSPFTHERASEFSQYENLTILCGRYEGIDERVLSFVDIELSIGDYVLTGGEIPAMVIIDSVSRLIPCVVGEKSSVENDSFYASRLDYPHYTRPYEVEGLCVPNILMSGDHKKIEKWRKKQSIKRTVERRPDLLKKNKISKEEEELLSENMLPEEI